MAYKPEIMSINDFVKLNQDAFTPYELWLTDELTDYLVAKRDLDKTSTSVVIDLDEDNPVYGYRDDNIFLRFNGRFYIPNEDKNIKRLNLKPDQWIELFKEWFKEHEIEVVIDEKATDLIKFTAIVSCLTMPEEAASDESSDTSEDEEPGTGEDQDESTETQETTEPETAPGGESSESEDLTEETPESGNESAETETTDDAELKEFEEALGL